MLCQHFILKLQVGKKKLIIKATQGLQICLVLIEPGDLFTNMCEIFLARADTKQDDITLFAFHINLFRVAYLKSLMHVCCIKSVKISVSILNGSIKHNYRSKQN